MGMCTGVQYMLKPGKGIRAPVAGITSVFEPLSSNVFLRVISTVNHQCISPDFVPFLCKEVSIICELNLLCSINTLYRSFPASEIFLRQIHYMIIPLEFYQYKMQSFGFNGRPICRTNALYIFLRIFYFCFIKSHYYNAFFFYRWMKYGPQILLICLSFSLFIYLSISISVSSCLFTIFTISLCIIKWYSSLDAMYYSLTFSKLKIIAPEYKCSWMAVWFL